MSGVPRSDGVLEFRKKLSWIVHVRGQLKSRRLRMSTTPKKRRDARKIDFARV